MKFWNLCIRKQYPPSWFGIHNYLLASLPIELQNAHQALEQSWRWHSSFLTILPTIYFFNHFFMKKRKTYFLTSYSWSSASPSSSSSSASSSVSGFGFFDFGLALAFLPAFFLLGAFLAGDAPFASTSSSSSPSSALEREAAFRFWAVFFPTGELLLLDSGSASSSSLLFYTSARLGLVFSQRWK